MHLFIWPDFTEGHGGVMDEDCTPSASPLVEAEMMINNVLSNFGESSAESLVLPLQTCQRVKTCKKREFICHPDFWDVWSDHGLFVICIFAPRWCTLTPPCFLFSCVTITSLFTFLQACVV